MMEKIEIDNKRMWESAAELTEFEKKIQLYGRYTDEKAKEVAKELMGIARKQIAEEISVDDIDGFDFDTLSSRHFRGDLFTIRPYGLDCYRKGVEDTIKKIKEG